VQITTPLDCRLSWTFQSRRNIQVDFFEAGAEASLYRSRSSEADFTLVIAPEFNDLLYNRCRWTEEVGGRLLGPSAAAVRVAGDKLRLAERFQQHGIPTPVTRLVTDSGPLAFPQVCKPRHGAGSQAVTLVHNEYEMCDALRSATTMGIRDDFIVQPYVRGTAASVSLLLGHEQCLVLPAATQEFYDRGRFLYRGGTVPLADGLNERAQRLARRAVEVVDGLRGYVGVDLVLGPADDGSQDVAIEINPRLTTSYVGLRALARFNLAEAMLALALDQPLPEMAWHAGSVRFQAHGDVHKW